MFCLHFLGECERGWSICRTLVAILGLSRIPGTKDHSLHMNGESQVHKPTHLLPIAAALVYLALFVGVDWIPWDDGMLAQMAVRVLGGEVPHRDFVDPYTGLLTLYHALVFDFLGCDLLNLRWALYAATIPFAYCLYMLFRLFLSPDASAWSTAGTLVSTLPIYFAPLPSWYLLFLSTIGFYCLIRWIDTGRSYLLTATGILIGTAAAIKINAILLIYAAALSIVYASQCRTSQGEKSPPRRKRSWLRLLLLSAILTAGILGPLVAIFPIVTMSRVYLFVAPTTAVSIAALLCWRRTGGPDLLMAMRCIIPFVLGIALVWVPFLFYFKFYGSLDSWLTGVFVAPLSRLELAALPPPDLTFATFLVCSGFYIVRRFSLRVLCTMLMLCLGGMTVVSLINPSAVWMQVVWPCLLGLIPIAILMSANLVIGEKLPARKRAVVFAVTCWAAFWNLNQFPHTGAEYLLYSIVPVLVCISAVVKATTLEQRTISRFLWGFVVIVSLLFQLPRLIPYLPLGNPGSRFLVPFEMKGASLLVTKEDVAKYHWLNEMVSRHSSPGPILAFPDLPEVYYLMERLNPTPFLYEFLGRPGGGPSDIERYLLDDDIRLVVMRSVNNCGFSEVSNGSEASRGIVRTLKERFPEHESQHGIDIWWR